MEATLSYSLHAIKESLGFAVPEIILATGILTILVVSLFASNKQSIPVSWLTFALFASSLVYLGINWSIQSSGTLFDGMIRRNNFASFFKILFDSAGILTVAMSMKNNELKNRFNSEYFTLLVAAVLGAHLLTMTSNFLMVFLALELLSLSSYVLAGFSMDKKGAEGSLKYFLFGSVASAVMLYGFSILFGLTGSLDFFSESFIKGLINNDSPLVLVAGLMAFAGFLYKIAAAPLHLWAPDVYEAAPMPVVAFFSVVPKLAGIAALTNFIVAINVFGQGNLNWQTILSIVAILSITVGNFSALNQTNPKRMMAYSSIAQSGFLLIGIICFSLDGLQFMIFYGCVYMVANFAVFISLQSFEKDNVISIPSFVGVGRASAALSIILVLSFISLAGIPPTAGFTAKLFIFTSLWETYTSTGNSIIMVLLVFGLLNTVVSLFYYLKIPYYAFIKSGNSAISDKKTGVENFLALLLVVILLVLFIKPDLLMGWVNRINFVL